jgi:hypothetical protein
MKRTATDLLIVFVLSFGGSNNLLAQSITADRFLESVSARPVGDEVEVARGGEAYQSLMAAPAAEVERELPSILQYALSGNEGHARKYAVLFLTGIAMRSDGADLLSSSSEQVSSLILDRDSGIQRGAVAVTGWVIAKAGANQQRYLSAMEAAMQRAQTPQDLDVQMVSPLLTFGSGDPHASESVLDFMHRNDLTISTRSDVVHSLGDIPGLPKEINQALVKELDDADPTVRVAAVVTFADSTSAFHTLAKDRVESMANDPQENTQVRELAKEAIAGKTHLDPNVLVPNVERAPAKPIDH